MQRICTPGDDSPRLCNRVDAAFVILSRPQWRTIIVISAAIPFAIPAAQLDCLEDLSGLGAISLRAGVIAHGVTHLRKIDQRGGEEPSQPDTFSLSIYTNAIHAIVPIVCAHKRNSMRTRGSTFRDGATAMLIECGTWPRGEIDRSVHAPWPSTAQR